MSKQTFKNSALASGGIWQIYPSGILENAILHSALIDNNQGNYDLEVRLNGSDRFIFLIPAGSGREIYNETFNYLEVKNVGSGEIPANSIYVTLSDKNSIVEVI